MNDKDYEIYQALAGKGVYPCGKPEDPDNTVNEQNIKRKAVLKGVVIGAVCTIAVCLTAFFIFYGSLKSSISEINETMEELEAESENGGVDITDSLLSDIIDQSTINKMVRIYKHITTSYLHDYDSDELQDSVIRGFVEGLGDTYTAYYDEEETTALTESISGSFYGIGVLMQSDLTTGYCIVLTVYDDTPASRAGIQEEDIIYKVDGEEVVGKDINYIASVIRGEEGTEVEITLLRGSSEVTVKCERALIEEQTVESSIMDDNIGYIYVSAFDSVTYDQFKENFDEVMAQNVDGLIIDLRSNGGGDVDITVQMLDELLGEGNALYMIDKNGERTDKNTTGNDDIDIPVVVLVNQYSASASEIFTGCLRDRLDATVVGVTTYGKGVVQSLVSLGDDTMLKITIAEYFTPSGYQVNGVGIIPDVEVEDDYETDADEQLDMAHSVILEEIGK